MNYYGMTVDILKQIWLCFLKIRKGRDKQSKHITTQQIIAFLDERDYSIVSQSFFRFFDVIDKEEVDRVTFHELLPALISFCLFTRSEILGFVFSMIDEDRDDFVSKADIFK